jgi:hypothetical protein
MHSFDERQDIQIEKSHLRRNYNGKEKQRRKDDQRKKKGIQEQRRKGTSEKASSRKKHNEDIRWFKWECYLTDLIFSVKSGSQKEEKL